MNALIYVDFNDDPMVRLGPDTDKVFVYPSGTVVVMSKNAYVPKGINVGKPHLKPFGPRPLTVTSEKDGCIMGTSKKTGDPIYINTAIAYVEAAERQGVPIQRISERKERFAKWIEKFIYGIKGR